MRGLLDLVKGLLLLISFRQPFLLFGHGSQQLQGLSPWWITAAKLPFREFGYVFARCELTAAVRSCGGGR